ncbi:MAG: GH3 auxin-responsive promoter family protein [Bacteroidales bacterium]|nr:GH3 auxin-responsive promoter family protein [Bacteroidales bacterium]MCF8327823.1 GH3 auxin-responsive promoter family protein [Bacteroidales bacterium]
MAILGSVIKRAIELKGKTPWDKNRTLNGTTAQTKVLRKQLTKAQKTDFGRRFHFDKILHSPDVVRAYKEKVPVFDYSLMHQEWWHQSLKGKTNITWPAQTRYFALSSGTSEASSKYIPVTNDMIRAIKKTSVRQIFTLARYQFSRKFFEKGILMLGGSTHLNYNGTYYEGDLSGITAGNIPFWFQHFYKPGKKIARERDWETKLDEIVKKAPEWDIGVIVGVPAWIQILLQRIIQQYNLNSIHDIWPNLNIYVHGGVSFSPYAHGFKQLLGKQITYIETYLASEGFIAYQDRPDSNGGMHLVIDNGLFFEFVPFNDENFDEEGNLRDRFPETFTIDQVKEGQQYALLISTCAGAYRYLIGDVVRFTNHSRYEIIITGRTKHFLNLCGEHVSQDNMNKAIELTAKDLNANISEFAVTGIEHEKMFAHKWYIGVDKKVSEIKTKALIDKHLKELNDDYKVERLAAIKDVFVEILPEAYFYEWLKRNGKLGGQHKFPRILKGEQLGDWINFLDTKKQNNS